MRLQRAKDGWESDLIQRVQMPAAVKRKVKRQMNKRWRRELKAETQSQCGHAVSEIVSSDEGTCYCRACEVENGH